MNKSSQIFQFVLKCSNSGLAHTVEKGQYFTTLDDAELDKVKGPRREVHTTSK